MSTLEAALRGGAVVILLFRVAIAQHSAVFIVCCQEQPTGRKTITKLAIGERQYKPSARRRVGRTACDVMRLQYIRLDDQA